MSLRPVLSPETSRVAIRFQNRLARRRPAGEFIRRVTVLGSARCVPERFDATRGKGSHGTLYYGDRFTVVKDRCKECGPGLLNKMLGDLGLRRRDLR
jgi:mRNA interferase HicA